MIRGTLSAYWIAAKHIQTLQLVQLGDMYICQGDVVQPLQNYLSFLSPQRNKLTILPRVPYQLKCLVSICASLLYAVVSIFM